MSAETLEEYWSGELGATVEIREVEGWGEVDVYVDGTFMVTTISLQTAETFLERYYMVKDEVSV